MSIVARMTQSDRPTQPARLAYRAGNPQEQFIVPLLKRRIEEALKLHARVFPRDVNRRALDVGCGRQPFRKQIEKLGFTYVGADIRQNPEQSVDFVCAIDGEIPGELARAAPFSLVIGTELLEHVADWDRAFSNLDKLTDAGGIVILTCPFFYPLHEEPYDFWRPTPHALRCFASRFGFRVERCEMAGDAWDVIGTMIGSLNPFPPGPRLASRIVAVLRRATWSIVRVALGGQVARLVMPLRGSIYLSNILVLSKP